MSWEAWFTLAVVAVTILLLVLDMTAPGAIVLGAVVALLVSDVLEPAEAFAGFGNPAPITVAALYVVAAGIERTGVLNRLVRALAGRSVGERVTLARMVVPSAAALLMFPVALAVAVELGARPAGVCRNDRSHCIRVVPHADRISDEHNGLGSRRLQIR